MFRHLQDLAPIPSFSPPVKMGPGPQNPAPEPPHNPDPSAGGAKRDASSARLRRVGLRISAGSEPWGGPFG
eukprot:15464961-Alexandrium_andersonii.AAC.1